MSEDCPNCDLPVLFHVRRDESVEAQIDGDVVVCSTAEGAFVHPRSSWEPYYQVYDDRHRWYEEGDQT